MDRPDAPGLAPTAGEWGGAMQRALVLLVVLGLVGAVAYLGADVNHRRYRLVARDGLLVVEQGRNMPFGFEPYNPGSEALRDAYAPLPLPPGASVSQTEVYTERSDLDRALFGVLAGWAHDRLTSTDARALDLASTYLARAERLPALSEEQRSQLHRLRGELAYHHAVTRLVRVGSDLASARSELDLARRYGSTDPRTVAEWIGDLDRMLGLFGALEPRLRAATGGRDHGGVALEEPATPGDGEGLAGEPSAPAGGPAGAHTLAPRPDGTRSGTEPADGAPPRAD